MEREPKIILISGATGVGKTRVGLELATRLQIQAIVSTDSVREILRSVIPYDINPVIHTSTYLAGQTAEYLRLQEEQKKESIMLGYREQAKAVSAGLKGVVKRAIEENYPLILDGIHIQPGDLSVLGEARERAFEIMVDIPDEEIHRRRFEERERLATKRKESRYLANFREIRWIRDHIVERGKESEDVVYVDNSGPIEKSVAFCVNEFYKKVKGRPAVADQL